MRDLICGLLGSPGNRGPRHAGGGRARPHRIMATLALFRRDREDTISPHCSPEPARARRNARYCLVQGYGHVVAEHAGPNGGKARLQFSTH